MSSRDFAEEMAYTRDNPSNETRLIYQLALVAYLIYLSNHDSKSAAAEPFDTFVMDFDRKKRTPSQSEEQMLRNCMRIGAMYSGEHS